MTDIRQPGFAMGPYETHTGFNTPRVMTLPFDSERSESSRVAWNWARRGFHIHFISVQTVLNPTHLEPHQTPCKLYLNRAPTLFEHDMKPK